MTSLRKLSILLLAFIGLVSLALFSLTSVYANIPTGEVDLKLVVVKGDLHDGGIDQTIPLPQFNYGSKASIDINGLELLTEKTFAFFVYKGELLTSRSTEFIVTDSTTVTAVFKGENEVVAVYVDTNGKVLDVLYGETGFTPESVMAPLNKPGYVFSGFNDGLAISVDTLFVATYTKANLNPYALTLNGGSATTLEPAFNEVVTLEANPGNFSYWKDEDNFMISRNPNFQFTALKDNVITAVYDAFIDDEPLVYLSNVSGINPGYQSFLGNLEFNNETHTLLEYGLLVSTDAKVLEKGMANVEVKPSGALAPTNEFLRSFVEDTYKSFRAYAIFDHEDGKVIKYSENNFFMVDGVMGLSHEENFTNSNATASYAPGNFTGVNNISWSFDARNEGEYPIDGKGIMITAGDHIQATFEKGIQTFSFKYRKAFTGATARALKIDITNNGTTETIEIPSFGAGSGEQTDIYTYLYTGLALNGEVTIKVYSTSNQTTIDDFKWTEYSLPDVSTKLFEIKLNDGVSTTSKSVSKNGLLTDVTTPTKEGYSFVRWLDENNQPFNLSTPITKHMELTAEYEINQYTLTFDSNGGTTVAPFTGDYNTLVEVPSNPTKEGYTFVGWLPAIPTNVPNSSQAYVAQWTANEYTLTFDVDGGDAIAPLTRNYGSVLVLPTPTKSGFSFLGWYSDSDKTELFEEITMSLSKTIYAKWLDASSTSTVTFEVNGGSDIEPLIVVNGQTLTQPTDPIKSGFTFAGWFTDVELANVFEFTTVINNDLDLYAKWVITVTFDANGGTPAIQTKALNLPGTVSNLDTVNRSGHTFVGWFDTNAETGGTQWTSETMINSNITYYARWQASLNTITIDSSGSFSTGISDGVIASDRLLITNTGTAIPTVSFAKNSSSTITIFNNSSGEIRLYGGSGNGGQLTISLGNDFLITKVIVTASTNNGLSINGGSSLTGTSMTESFELGLQSLVLKNVASGTNQVRITLITIEYSQS